VAFKGFPAGAVEFFLGLEADNSKAYWQAHKADYDSLVREPMDALVAELAPEFGDGKVFRPYRDVRFSADKTPYKTNIAATIGRGYVTFDADGLGVGSGCYMPAPDQLERFRAAVAADKTGEELTGLVAAATRKGLDVSAHDTLKTAPKGYPRDHPRIDLLRQKGLIVWKHWDPAPWMATAKAKERIAGVIRDADPLNGWLDRNVGESDLLDRGRR
jgi:uncharacterized protein (TIGR02453 family)